MPAVRQLNRAPAIFAGLFGGLTVAGVALGGIMSASAAAPSAASSNSFGSVTRSVDAVSKLIVLSSSDKQKLVAVSPAMQGRVLTSSAAGMSGRSYGWVNEELIGSRQVQKHFNAYGGEDRVWIGPEGGQYSVFFAPEAPFDLAHWYTPAPVDTEPFQVVRQSQTAIELRKAFSLLNYSGTQFQVQIDREVSLLSADDVWRELNVPAVTNLKIVGFQSRNKLTNMGSKPWKRETGLLSLWILGQFQASADSTIVIPIRMGSEAELGTPVTSDYFGPVPSSRLVVRPGVIFLKADAHYRSKVGVSPKRAKGVVGSYDAENHVLTIVRYTVHPGHPEYVNSAWKIQTDPYNGDVGNAYNDGPPPSGGPQLGHFYEMESSSPAADLAPGHSIEHTQCTIHLQGDDQELDKVSVAVLGVSLDATRNALPQ
jgi:hypothetical protein